MTHLAASSSTIAPVGSPRSPWHSPVPYLFGGLAAMLGLIAFALLILACSYWRLSGYLEENQEGDIEEGNNNNSSGDGDVKMVDPPILEDKFLVIMAGQLKPTYIATPSLSSRASSFGSTSSCTASSEISTDKSEGEENDEEKMKEENGFSRLIPENEEVPTGSASSNGVSSSTRENEEVSAEGVSSNDVSSSTPENEEVPTRSVSSCN